jgi:SAM-dependent methyltransferase
MTIPERQATAVPNTSPRRAFSVADAQLIAQTAVTNGWRVAAHDGMRVRNHAAYRMAVDEYRAQMRVLLPLQATSHVLHLRSGWGAIACALRACVASVTAVDDRAPQIRFLEARSREQAHGALHVVRADPSRRLPFAEQQFDAAVLIDVPVGRVRERRWNVLDEVWRLLKPGGWLLLAVPNLLGFARPHGVGHGQPRGCWGYQRAVQRAGFNEPAFYAPLPSHEEPFFIVPLAHWRLLNHFVDGLFTAQDYRFKLEARGLGAAYRMAWWLWRAGRHARLTHLARYVMPGYLIVAQRQG